MTPYLTATQAASKLGKSEKTIRRWIKEGRLHAHHPHGRANMFAIAEDDIEQLAIELAQYEQQPQAGELDQQAMNVFIANMAARLATLEDSFRDYQAQAEQRLAALESLLSVGTPAQPAAAATSRTRTPYPSATIARIEPLEHLPQGSMPHYRFAEMHGVKPRTFLDHLLKGHVPNIERQKPNRKETSHWLSPEQQRAAIVYWQANDTPYHECELCPHTDEIYQRAGESEQSAEDQEKPTA